MCLVTGLSLSFGVSSYVINNSSLYYKILHEVLVSESVLCRRWKEC
jgi:hypothetical protein